MNWLVRGMLVAGVVVTTSVPALTEGGRAVPLELRARGAARVVVATLGQTSSRYEKNDQGDVLIVSYAKLQVEEVLKGQTGPTTVAFEGGTVNGVTMRSSAMPTLARGDRAVFYLVPGQRDEFRPYLDGQGVLKLDAQNRVLGSSLTLDEVRRTARAASAK